jgi:hypothetical protein
LGEGIILLQQNENIDYIIAINFITNDNKSFMPEIEVSEMHPYAEIDFSGVEGELDNVQRDEEKGVYTGEFSVGDNAITIEFTKTDKGWDVVMTDSNPVKKLGGGRVSRGAKNLKLELKEAREHVEWCLSEMERLNPNIEQLKQAFGEFGEVEEFKSEDEDGKAPGYVNTKYEGAINIDGEAYTVRAFVDRAAGTAQYPSISPWTVRLFGTDRSVSRAEGQSIQEAMSKLVKSS